MADHSSVSKKEHKTTATQHSLVRLHDRPCELLFDARDSAPFIPKCAVTETHAQPPRGPWTEMIIYEAHMEAYQSCIRRCPKIYAAPSARSPRPPFSTISATSESVVVFSRVYRESTRNGGVEHSRRSAHR